MFLHPSARPAFILGVLSCLWLAETLILSLVLMSVWSLETFTCTAPLSTQRDSGGVRYDNLFIVQFVKVRVGKLQHFLFSFTADLLSRIFFQAFEKVKNVFFLTWIQRDVSTEQLVPQCKVTGKEIPFTFY